MKTQNKTKQEHAVSAVAAFRRAIIDAIGETANGGEVVLTTAVIKAAAFPAIAGVLAEEFDTVEVEGKPTAVPVAWTATDVAVIWEAVLHVNDPAFRQTLAVDVKAGTLPFKLASTEARMKGIALSYIK